MADRGEENPLNFENLDIDVTGCGTASQILLSHYETFNVKEYAKDKDHDDVEHLKKRISELEHLVVTSTLNITPFLDASCTRLSQQSLIQRVSQLESLLAGSEIDNRRLEHEIELLKASKQELEVHLYRSIKDRDICTKNLKQDAELLTVQLLKSNTTIRSMEEYIHTLPSEQELDDAKQGISKAYLRIDVLENNVERLEGLLKETRKDLSEKEKLYSRAIRRLEELQPIEEAQNSVLEGVQSEPQLMELATIQKTQLLKATKILKAQRRSICEMETEKSDLLLQVTENKNSIASLESTLRECKYQIEDTLNMLKISENGKNALEAQVQELQLRITDSERWITVRKNEMNNLVRLVTEVDFTILDLKKLISFCQSLSLGDEPLLEDLLFLETNDDPENLDSYSNNSEKPSCEIDVEWILQKLKSVRDARNGIKMLRTQVNEIYTDILGSGRGCIVS